MKIYISGKITGTTDYQRRFADAEARIKESGCIAINPARLPSGLSWRESMIIALTMLFQADAIYMLSGWQDSKGAVIEHMLAEALNLMIFKEGKNG